MFGQHVEIQQLLLSVLSMAVESEREMLLFGAHLVISYQCMLIRLIAGQNLIGVNVNHWLLLCCQQESGVLC